MADHALLLMAHADPELMLRLIRALHHPRLDIFVHIDRRARSIFPSDQRIEEAGAVHVESRVLVNWGGFSQVDAILGLLKASHARRYSTYSSLSGSDYPLRSTAETVRALDSLGGSLVDWFPAPDAAWRWRYEQYHFHDAHRLLQPWLHRAAHRLYRFWRRTLPDGCRPTFGSAWWTLTHEAADCLLEFAASRPRAMRFFGNVHIPDEMFVPTVLRSMAPELSLDRRTRRFIEWQPEGNHPRILRTADLDTLRSSNALFARKFSSGIDSRILDLLDEARSSGPAFLPANSPAD